MPGMSKTKTEPIFPTSTAVDAEASSESAAPPASGTSRQRALAVRKAGSSNAVSGPNREAKLEGSKQRKGKQHGGSAAAVGSAPPQPANRRRPRGSSVTFAADYSTPCVAASTISRPSSPSNDGNRYKKASVGPKNAPLPTGTSMSKEEKINLPSAVGKSSAGVPTTSLRVSHRNWQSNCMLLYKHIMSHILEWPTLSVQWLHSCNPRSNGEIGQTLLLSTHTSGGAANYLLLMEVSLPSEPIDASGLHYEQRQDYQGFEFGDEDTRKFTITARIPHEGESNRARIFQGNDTLIASKANDGCVYLFDSCKFGPELCASDAESEESQSTSKRGQMAANAEAVLTGHTAQGWGLEWSPTREGWLASSGDDGLVCIWDTRSSCGKEKRLSPVHCLVASSDRRPLQDVAWKRGDDAGEVIVAVGDDGQLNIWDLRAGASPVHRQCCNHACANVLALNPVAPNVFATGGADAGLSVWDFRDLRRPAHRLLYLEDEALTSLKWHPQNKAVLAAGATDRYVRIFDCSLIGAEQSPEEAEEGAPEVIFVHGGHVAGITEIDWNPIEDKFPWAIASASEDNVLQIWQPSIKAFEIEEANFLYEEGSMDEEILD
ncbi:WD-40 repeat protein, putative [Eimeria necatrix]|uniref:WD-40 repeat protein, putative n=1 Tax=Eimeria necatrix TaxID=51315 RepID=U6MH37_9EIME|nr:WD-40 repeat protein, putative [Eimeria necatrix]CDJ63346.1 WD-40 repeat protein, putative [Eimeria necatrix]